MSKQEIFNFATIGEIFEDGVSLIFDGQDAATEKHYKVNTSIVFKAGDRVKIFPDSGTYVVEYVVGSPLVGGSDEGGESSSIIPSGGTAGQALIKLSDADNDYAWGDPRAKSVVNRFYSSSQLSDIYFQTDSNGDYYIRKGTSGTWRKITVT